MARVREAAVTDPCPSRLPLQPDARRSISVRPIRTLANIDSLRLELRRLGDTGDGVSVVSSTIRKARDADRRYLVGCDGGQSAVRRRRASVQRRRARGAGLQGGPRCRPTSVRPGSTTGVLRTRGWSTTIEPDIRSKIVTVAGRGEFLFNTRLKTATTAGRRAHRARVRAMVGEDVRPEIVGHWTWTAGHALVADAFGAGRVLLAGDAVHLFTPVGGFGMNTGIDDVANLGWKLVAVMQGWGGPHLLSTYETERRPIAFRNTGAAKTLGRSIGNVPMGPPSKRRRQRRSGAPRSHCAAVAVRRGIPLPGSSRRALRPIRHHRL